MGGLATPDCLSREGSPGPEYSESHTMSHSQQHQSLPALGNKTSQSAPGSPKHG